MTSSNMHPDRRTVIRRLAGGAAAFMLPAATLADTYPSKPLKLLVPFPPGGASDASARIVAEALSRQLGQAVVVENRPGAGGVVSGQAVAQSAPDGYTLMLAYNGLMTIIPLLGEKMPFDVLKDVMAVGKVGEYPSVLCVHPNFSASSLKDIIALASATPGGLQYGTSGLGTVEHLLATTLMQRTGAKLVHVPYKGAGPLITDAIGGHVPMVFLSIGGGIPHIRAGKLKAIAVSSANRVSALPDVPTISESGVPNLVMNNWIGLITRSNTPRPVLDRLNSELNIALANSEVKEKLVALSVGISPGTVDAFQAQIKRELEMNAPLVKAAGLAPS